METKSESPQPGDLITKSAIKDEYGLTERQIGCLGAPDLEKRNPRFRTKGAPMKLYSRARVEQWVRENAADIAATEVRKGSASKATWTKREATRRDLARHLQDLRMDPAPRRQDLVTETRQFIYERHGSIPEEVSEKAICSHLRHDYTNYDELLAAVEGRVGLGEFYAAVKLVFCCRIVKHYGLRINPLVAAFGSVEEAPDWLRRGDPEAAAQKLLGTEVGVASHEQQTP